MNDENGADSDNDITSEFEQNKSTVEVESQLNLPNLIQYKDLTSQLSHEEKQVNHRQLKVCRSAPIKKSKK